MQPNVVNNDNNNDVGGAGVPWGRIELEREQRQRSVRVWMIFLFILLLLDEDGNKSNNNNGGAYNDQQGNLRGGLLYDHAGGGGPSSPLLLQQQRQIYAVVYESRRQQDERLRRLSAMHPRYQQLIRMNEGKDMQRMIEDWVLEQSEMERDEFGLGSLNHAVASSSSASSAAANNVNPGGAAAAAAVHHINNMNNNNNNDPEADRKVWHYPWNATGFYRGEWKLLEQHNPPTPTTAHHDQDRILDDLVDMVGMDDNDGNKNATATTPTLLMTPQQLEPWVSRLLQDRGDEAAVAAVVLLPRPIQRRNDNNLTCTSYDTRLVDLNGQMAPTTVPTPTPQLQSQPSTTLPGIVMVPPPQQQPAKMTMTTTTPPKVSLTQDTGRVALQLFARRIPGLREMSIVDGFIKLYESSNQGYSSRKDVLLRVRGVLIHSLGQLSLVNFHAVDRTALVINNNNDKNDNGRTTARGDDAEPSILLRTQRWLLTHGNATTAGNETLPAASTSSIVEEEVPWSDYVIPYPFSRDTAAETLRLGRTQAARLMPLREQALEANAAACDFEINLSVAPSEWKVGHWRKLIFRRVAEARRLLEMAGALPAAATTTTNAAASSPADHPVPTRPVSVASVAGRGRRRRKQVQDEALVLHLTGTIHSPNCNFTAYVNTTALRTDWDATTGKAITYSFYMLIVCLLQIVLLLRQVLHSQTLATATRVSLLGVGWHTTIDALHCLVHIYLSLAISPLFTAFASVAFFKLLIFCVIEMKYMVVIIQARNSSSEGGGQVSPEAFRKQVAMLHLRFYSTLMVVFVILFYALDKYRTACVLLLYSFWVPQIVLNVVTEARTPLHRKYVYGMSITRIVAPFYVFAISDNFLKEVYPESPTDALLVLKLAAWLALQVALLICQEKYGARFMIPARFLPPKFDYSRPLPPSMIPPGALDLPVPELIEDRSERSRGVVTKQTEPMSTAVVGQCRHKTAETTRNRLKSTAHRNSNNNGGTMVSEEHHRIPSPSSLPAPTLECSICYDDIDIRDRPKYMLAPCNHLFHRDCLSHWMDAKLECPICRTSLPPL